MAKAEYKCKDRVISKVFGAPKRQTLEAWFKEIRKVIPEVPDPKTTDWLINHQYADETNNRWITFEMSNTIEERAVITVDRSHSFLMAS